MPELLSLADSHLPLVINGQVLADGVLDMGRFNKIIPRNVRFGVIFHHTGIGCFGTRHPVEIRKILIFKSPAYLDCPVTTKVEEDYRVAIADRTHRIA